MSFEESLTSVFTFIHLKFLKAIPLILLLFCFSNGKVLIALYFIVSRDVPILKSFSAGRPKIFVCCSRGCSVVAAVAELWWPIAGCKNGKRKQRIAYRTFPISKQNIKTIKVITTWPSIDVQSVQRSHNDFLRPNQT